MPGAKGVRSILRRVLGAPAAAGRVPSRTPLLFDRYQVSFDALSLPPLPAPLLLVHTAGKPMNYRAAGERRPRLSLPGLVSFIPAGVRSEAALHGVGEGTLVHFDGSRPTPAWLRHGRYRSAVTFTNEVIVAISRRLMHELESGSGDGRHLRTLGEALVAELKRELTRSEATPVPPSATRTGLLVAQTATRYVRAHLAEPLTVAVLAKQCGVGSTLFAREFRQAMGTTPHRYVRRMRLERACELLRTTSLSVFEISGMVGFRGQAHFSTAFVAERGLTPTAYRRGARPVAAARVGRGAGRDR